MENTRRSYEVTRPTKGSADTNATPALPPLGILAGLSERSLAELASYGHYHYLTPGNEIMREGEMQDHFYVVVSGQMEISARICGQEKILNTAGPGECLGEVSLLEPGPASATVKVIEEATLWSMNMDDLRKYLSEHVGGAGALLTGMASCLSKRLRQANQLICQHHVMPVETLPEGRERAITATNAPVQIGFFDKLKKSLGGEKKVQISTQIKM